LIGYCLVKGRAVFLAVEVKAGTDSLSKEQTAFLDQVNHDGGIAFVASSLELFREIIEIRRVTG
jgi:hypothetical protein